MIRPIDIETRSQLPLTGRQKVHDERSRSFATMAAIDKSTWRAQKAVRIYDPWPNPNQSVGNCTMTTKAMQFNQVGNRKMGEVLDMDWATEGYRLVTTIDPFEGSWEPDDTGSSALASCKAAQRMGKGGAYYWEFRGVDGVIQNIQNGRAMSLGTWWYGDMFGPTGGLHDGKPIFTPTGWNAGGHQWLARGVDLDAGLMLGRTWWGEVRDFWLKISDVQDLLMDGGDAHYQVRA